MKSARPIEDWLPCEIEFAGVELDVERSLARALETADRAIGVKVLTQLHQSMCPSAHPVNLSRLWTRLGVVPAGDRVTFNDRAPLAAIRKAIIGQPPH